MRSIISNIVGAFSRSPFSRSRKSSRKSRSPPARSPRSRRRSTRLPAWRSSNHDAPAMPCSDGYAPVAIADVAAGRDRREDRRRRFVHGAALDQPLQHRQAAGPDCRAHHVRRRGVDDDQQDSGHVEVYPSRTLLRACARSLTRTRTHTAAHRVAGIRADFAAPRSAQPLLRRAS